MSNSDMVYHSKLYLLFINFTKFREGGRGRRGLVAPRLLVDYAISPTGAEYYR